MSAFPRVFRPPRSSHWWKITPNVSFEFFNLGIFHIFWLLKLTSSYSKLSIFDIFELLSTQKVNVGVGRFSLAMLNSTFWAIFKHCVQCVGVEKLRLQLSHPSNIHENSPLKGGEEVGGRSELQFGQNFAYGPTVQRGQVLTTFHYTKAGKLRKNLPNIHAAY